MTATQSRLLGIALLLAAVSLLMHLTNGRDSPDASERSASREDVAGKGQEEQDYARSRARFEQGAFVLRTTQLSDREVVQVVVIPEGYSEELDTRCVIYQNSELRTSAMDCGGVMFRRPAPQP